MGEVYRGRDTALNRDVAIKVLLPAVATDQERLARFNREAQVLASLNHPNIAQIHGVEQSDAGPLLVLEYVAGPTLADRVVQGPIPIDEALAIARQIADALEAAHERGVIHRDLKPANIKVSEDGAVKVLDFGLAKAIDQGSGIGDQGSGERANSPTITTPAMTQAGLILGTAAYMSPEQAKGRVVDKRSDVWAFGCVLYEMISGKRAFDGEDVTDTIAAVVRGEPNWSALPPDVPPQVRLLLKRCLEKDRRARISDISVARFLMNETIPAPSSATLSAPRSRRAPAVAVAVGLAIGAIVTAAMWLVWAPQPQGAALVRFVFAPPSSQPLMIQGNDRDVAIAPDGSFIVYRSGSYNQTQPSLSLRGVNELEPRPLPGTTNGRSPFISPDGRWVGFQAGTEIRKVAVAGGPTVLIARISGTPRGVTWGDDGYIVFGTPNGLQRVSDAGGEPTALTTLDPNKPEQHVLPHLLPGSRWLVFTAFPGSDYLSARLEALEVGTGRRKLLVPAGHDAAYVESGHLIYGLTNPTGDGESRFQASLRAVRFDPVRIEVSGESLSLVEQVRVGTSPTLNYSVSRRGDLAYVPGGAGLAPPAERTLTWVNRRGQETAIAAPPRTYAVARLSPDGTRVALDIRDQTIDIAIWDLSRQTLSPLSRHPAQDLSPIWTSDGKRVIWTSTRGGGNPNLFWQAADGTGEAERLTVSANNQFPTSTTPDGSILVFGASGDSKNASDLFTIPLKDPTHKAELLLSAAGMDFDPEVSPDGKWLAYHSNISGEFQVYVRPFPNVQAGRWQISTLGGSRAAWSRTGRELLYLDQEGLLTSVAIPAVPGATFTAGPPVKILNRKYYAGASLLGLDLRAYDVSSDGQRFLMIKESASVPRQAQEVNLVLVLNWVEELRARLPSQ